jgi:hypothetical protein
MKWLLASVLAALACGGCANQQILRSAATPTPDPAAAAATPLDPLEQEIKAMRTADFNFIYIFRRKDGGGLDAEDKKTASANIPPEINRRKVIDDGKAIIIGSNYRLPPENFKVMSSRFVVEDYSKPESEMINANVNTNANSNKGK